MRFARKELKKYRVFVEKEKRLKFDHQMVVLKSTSLKILKNGILQKYLFKNENMYSTQVQITCDRI